jgi:ABC-type transport system involved in multi-copper enzyme maturation permease subunit
MSPREQSSKRRNVIIKGLGQIGETTRFEWERNWGKLVAMIGTAVMIIGLNIIIELLQLNRGAELAEDAASYVQGYLGFLNLFIYIVAVTFCGSIIVEDFEKSTGNLLFPKITKDRLLIGRFIARYIYGLCALVVYYLGIVLMTFIRYSEFVTVLLDSFGWAAYYLLAVYAFVTLFSSFFKRAAGSIIVSLLSLLIVFNMIQSIMQFTGVTAEPFYFLTYYGNIITAIVSGIPEERFIEVPFGPPSEPDAQVFYMWSTPNELGAGIGLLVYTVILLLAAYVIYSLRQNKGN